jgi:hypothetical protein
LVIFAINWIISDINESNNHKKFEFCLRFMFIDVQIYKWDNIIINRMSNISLLVDCHKIISIIFINESMAIRQKKIKKRLVYIPQSSIGQDQNIIKK